MTLRLLSSRLPPEKAGPSSGVPCRHCGGACPDGGAFCCPGCAGAYALIRKMGLDTYYERRVLNPDAPPLVPVEADRMDFSPYVTVEGDASVLNLMVDGLHCAACVWLIETVLERQSGVRRARLNMTTRRLRVVWNPVEGGSAQEVLAPALRLGYRLVPYDPARGGEIDRREEQDLLLSLAVAGFAAMNVMLLSVALWAGVDPHSSLRTLLQWYSALVVLPASAFALRPFARPAWEGLRHGRITMDVPITLAVVLTLGMSVYETLARSAETYFEAAASLLFFLLIGRYLDRLTRSRALSAAQDLLLLQSHAATVVGPDGVARAVPSHALRPGDILLIARGERAGADGVVTEGVSSLDTATLTGESLPRAVAPGQEVPAGAVNLGAPLRLRVTAAGAESTLGRMAALAEAAAQTRNRYTRIADRAARFYAPAVHTLALLTLAFWWAHTGDFHAALTHAVAVLIVTCPCALALAVPAVQVAAASALLRAGILLKNPEALEKLEAIDTVVFDKTGTLTRGDFALKGAPDPGLLRAAAGLAASSTHPLSRALVRAAGEIAPRADVREVPGAGLEACDGARLGSAVFCGAPEDSAQAQDSVLWYRAPEARLHRFVFEDSPRPDACRTVAAFAERGMDVILLSGDRPGPVAALARRVGIADARAEQSPEAKFAALRALAAAGRKVLMVGDGINDAPSLAAAEVSVSPGSAATLTQNAADVVLQGRGLWGAFALWHTARQAARAIRVNFALSIAYNFVAVPLAMAGVMTPLIAALFMSASSITVMLNAMRLGRTLPAPPSDTVSEDPVPPTQPLPNHLEGTALT
jgi:Cu2+-exporting ATPase